VAEPFIRTIKEQVISGRVFQNLRGVREAVRRFVDVYNCEWLVEKNGFKSPWQARPSGSPKPHSLERLKKLGSRKPDAVQK
jgi:hypothetical protein